MLCDDAARDVGPVRRVTHIAPAGPDGKIVGYDVVQEGVVLSNSAGKGKGATNATYATTTEVYPDSKVLPLASKIPIRAVLVPIYRYTVTFTRVYRYTGNPDFARSFLGCAEADFCN